MTTRCFLKSSSINDFRGSASKRVLAPAVLFAVLFAGLVLARAAGCAQDT